MKRNELKLLTGEILLKNGFELIRKGKHEEVYELNEPNDFNLSIEFRHREGYQNFIKIRFKPILLNDRWLDKFFMRLGKSTITCQQLNSIFDMLIIDKHVEP